MNKVLSICMPSYNMEKYIHRSMKSLLVPEVVDSLEIIIVNDGSKDKTLEIASDYKAKYPQSVVVIDKPNVHYGSCINAALKVATGKYFRVLDTDDWFNSESLVQFVHVLERINAEAIYTPYSIYYEKNASLVLQQISPHIVWNKLLDLNEYNLDSCYTHMHCLTYKLSFIKGLNYQQTEGICYTDTEYVYQLLGTAKDLYCANIDLYQYYIGRDDQSMSPTVLSKNFSHFFKVLTRLIQFKSSKENKNMTFLRQFYIQMLYSFTISIHLHNSFDNKSIDDSLRSSIDTLKEQGDSIDFLSQLTIHKYKYALHWYRKDYRLFDQLFWLFVRRYDKW